MFELRLKENKVIKIEDRTSTAYGTIIRKVDTYTIGFSESEKPLYTVRVHKASDDSYVAMNILGDREVDYLPRIYAREDLDSGNIVDFEIQTTSYGALSPCEMRKFIGAHRYALEAVNLLSEKFL